MKSCK